MTEAGKESYPNENMQEYLKHIQRLLENLASTNDAKKPETAPLADQPDLLADALPHQSPQSELKKIIHELHPANLADIMAALPIEQRKLVWNSISLEHNGKVLIEASEAVRETLIAVMSHAELRSAAQQLNISEVADLAPHLPQTVIRDVFKSLTIEEREQLRAAMSYPQDSVGALMDFDMVTIRQDATIESVLRYLRRLEKLPAHTDQLFIVDRDNTFQGVLPLNKLLINEPEIKVSTLMTSDELTLQPDDKMHHIAQAFKRRDLVSMPVIDEDEKLVGRLPVNAVVNFIRSKFDKDMLHISGLYEEEDIFASVWKSAKNRWLWLSLNLCITFLASRVIGGFENSIEKFVALAALMPIVAGIAGNAGNQTIAIIIRSLALGQINEGNARNLLVKELTISLLNGLVWGSIAGGFAYLQYKSLPLGLVMASAMLLNFLLGALAGMLIPLALQKLGRDPAIGSGILLTAITSSGGFFIFLGLATIFLVN